MTPDYGPLVEKISALAASVSPDQRNVEWLTPASVIGVSRTHSGRLEIFMAGDPLEPTSRFVRECLEHQTWHRAAGQPSLDASRLLLPSADHYDQITAFICTELLRNGADQDLAAAFRRSEAIIELAISRLRIGDQTILGLSGELLLLDALLRKATDGHVAGVINSWQGWRRSTRDFALKSTGVEVKTTTRNDSSHHMQGLHQVEPQPDEDPSIAESSLFLVSIGLTWTDGNSASSYSLPQLVDSIIERLRVAVGVPQSSEIIDRFLSRLKEYGTETELGYDHQTMADQVTFSRPFVAQFVRCYDMSDRAIEVLRSDDVRPRRHIDLHSLSFRIDLPTHVHGNLNPVAGLNATAEAILNAEANA